MEKFLFVLVNKFFGVLFNKCDVVENIDEMVKDFCAFLNLEAQKLEVFDLELYLGFLYFYLINDFENDFNEKFAFFVLFFLVVNVFNMYAFKFVLLEVLF